MKRFRCYLILVVFSFGCGESGDTDPEKPSVDSGPVIPKVDAAVQTYTTVNACVGPSCPLGECGPFDGPCDAYDSFDGDDNSMLCAGATGSNQFCLKTPDVETIVDCSSATVVKFICQDGCGYNYAPDDCGVCNGFGGCEI